jgi:thiol:disulfide interchange protein DsbA
MTNFPSVLKTAISIALLMLLTACGSPEPSQPDAAQTAGAELAQATEVAIVEAEAETATEEAAGESTIEVVEESAGESENDQEESEVIALAASTPEASVQSESAWKFSAGKHYTELVSAQGTSSAPDKIEVAEVFWYGCPHCFNFDPYLARWETTLPDDVTFVRIPVMWNPTNEIHARVFYTAEALGKLDEMHEAIFREMHQNQKTLTNEADIRKFFESFGVSAADFDSTFRSFAVDSKLKRARNLTERYRIQSVPVLVVNGKYLATGPEVKDFDGMLNVTNELILREREQL